MRRRREERDETSILVWARDVIRLSQLVWFWLGALKVYTP